MTTEIEQLVGNWRAEQSYLWAEWDCLSYEELNEALREEWELTTYVPRRAA